MNIKDGFKAALGYYAAQILITVLGIGALYVFLLVLE